MQPTGRRGRYGQDVGGAPQRSGVLGHLDIVRGSALDLLRAGDLIPHDVLDGKELLRVGLAAIADEDLTRRIVRAVHPLLATDGACSDGGGHGKHHRALTGSWRYGIPRLRRAGQTGSMSETFSPVLLRS